ncbi:glycosyl transferase family 2 [Acinetobacter sp. Ac_3412]|uniref:glycosyltransferase family 2 protein n=1 Tax=Acinetobacter sp. Ac_3412 TaxID=1848935 RepID=UPI00148FE3D5|nr:glycosyltransferase [Acinetobacter sp. Ac_3412]NNP75077.1 glycosyl transferase family 2 [Acinetobacter sp. Ac_3412]
MQSNVQPLVSVVIPCYNHMHYVHDCIKSVIDQTYQNIELIIIDDGSKDHSIEKIRELINICEQRFIRFEFRHRANKGLSATLNEALSWCRGEYYSIIASDDMMLSEKIMKQANFLKESDHKVAGVFGGYHLIDDDNNVIETALKDQKKYNFNDVFLHNFDLPAPTALLRLNAVKEVGGYAENLKIEDWYMWLKLTEKGNSLIYLNEVFVNYRSHGSNISKNLEIMNVERRKVIDCFKNNKLYNDAKLKIQWLKATDYSYINKVQALAFFKDIIVESPIRIFSVDFLRFTFHFLKSIVV